MHSRDFHLTMQSSRILLTYLQIEMIRRLAEHFSNLIASDKRDQIEEEYALYQTVDLPSDIQRSTPVDISWEKIGIKYRKDFWVTVKLCQVFTVCSS